MSNDKNPRDSSRDRRRDRKTLGSSRGGLSTKIHLAADGRARPLADKGYSSRGIRSYLRRRGIQAVIPEPSDQIRNRQRRGSRGGRPVTFDNDAYRLRNTVERAVGKLRGYRAVATRYDKRDYVYRGTVDIAAIGIWLRDPTTSSARYALGVGGRHPVAPLRGETERQVGPLERTSARKADSGTHGGGGAGKILKKIQAWLSIRRQSVRRR